MTEQVALDLANTSADPIEQFERWFADAQGTSLALPESVALATATEAGVPAVRMVLCKGFDARGFVFYTNHDSPKGQALAENPRAELLFYWEPLARQVRIAGSVERLSAEASAAYFQTRPHGSQLAAWASPQSQVVADRAALEEAYDVQASKYEPGAVPCPPFWGGYRVRPHKIEFWQGRDNRFHDRICYIKAADADRWDRVRLAP